MEEQKKSSYKPYWLILILGLVIILGATYYLVYYKPDNTPINNDKLAKNTTLGATFIYVEGAVEYQKPGQEWQRAAVDTDLYEGYAVEILGQGRAIINLDDGSALRLNNDSKITLTRLNPERIIITNDKGEVYSRVVKANRTYQVKTGEIIYESLGTAYNTINNDAEKGVEVYESSVTVKEGNKDVVVAEGKKYYLKKDDKPEEINQVKDLSAEEVTKDEFVMWNKEKDTAANKELGFLDFEDKITNSNNNGNINASPETPGRLTLAGSATEKGVSLSWTVSNLDASKGYKLVKSLKENPVFPGDYYVYLSKTEQKTYTWEITDGKTWHFRVCQYLGSECGVYSNDISVTAPLNEAKETPSGVKSITLSEAGRGQISWITDGTAASGYKVVWSKTSGPAYPTRSTDKYKATGETTATLTAFDGTGLYYARVCEYLGGKCGTYSNEINLTLTEKEETPTSSVNSITLTDAGGGKITWVVDGTSTNGYKVTWSKTAGPTFPTRETDSYKYISDPSILSATLTVFDGAGSYYVRVCEYLGSVCGTYSNEIQITL